MKYLIAWLIGGTIGGLGYVFVMSSANLFSILPTNATILTAVFCVSLYGFAAYGLLKFIMSFKKSSSS